MALVEPPRPRPVAGDHAQQPGQALAVAVRNDGARPMLHRPSRGPETPRQVDVAARADALDEAAKYLERPTSDEEVSGRRREVADQAVVDAEEVSRSRVPGKQARLSGVTDDRARDRPAVVWNRARKIGVHETGRGDAVGVHEQNPVVDSQPGAHVSRVV